MSNLGLELVNTAIMDLHQTIQNIQQSNKTIPFIIFSPLFVQPASDLEFCYNINNINQITDQLSIP